jgi:hypothetical protein
MSPSPRSLLALTLLSLVACRTPAPAAGSAEAPGPIAVEPVVPVASYADAKLGMEVAQGELRLPARYLRPILRPAPGEGGLAQVYLVRPTEPIADARERKRAAMERRAAIEEAAAEVAGDQSLREALGCYGRLHGGVGPATLDDPDFARCVARGPYADDDAPLPRPPPWPAGSPEAQAVAGLRERLARFALLPNVPLRHELIGDEPPPAPPAGKGKKVKGATTTPPAPRRTEPPSQPLLVEVAPAADDGRHWVLDNALRLPQGRVAVDAALLARHGLSLRKDLLAEAPPARPDPDAPVTWKVFALRRGAQPDVTLELEPERGAPVQRLGWAIGKGAPGGVELLREWAFARLLAQDVFGEGDGPLQLPLAAAALRAYGLDEARLGRLGERLGRSSDGDGAPSLLALLGGRAAVDETLQLDRALAAEDGRTEPPSIPIGAVEGITVEPHPWKELLAGRATPRLPLADCVPPDRAMLYLPQPKEALDGFEHGAAGFLQRVSSFARQGRLDYAVIERYLDDLGLGGGLGRKLLRVGAVKEAVIFTTDLSLLSGTDVTVVAEVSPLFLPLLPIGEGEVKEKATAAGSAFKARRGARVFISTSRPELERALALDAAGGAGSLGRSEELAYLLLQLAPTERTQAFAYLSDPFIRRLVGPAQRIAQARLDHARAEMELLAGAALLRRQDAPGEPPTIEGLKRLGYLPPEFPDTAYTLRPDGRVASPVFGPLERLRPVSHLDLASVTPGEAERYERFREQYSRYWRRFFDPIAVRLDVAADGGQALETFILPLLDSSIYRELARELAPEARPSMHAPRWSFPASVEASLQLPEKSLEEAAGGARIPHELEEAGVVIPADVLDSIVPTLHVAYPDAAPILQVGGGSAFGVLAAPTERGEVAAIPMLVAGLTRPMVLAVELKDPERVRRALDRMISPAASPRPRGRRDDFRVRLARDADDRLIVSADLFGIVTLRHTLRVEDRWLVLANDTTLPAKLIAGAHELRGAAASVALQPGALRLGLPSAWQAASDAEADAAWAAQHWLAPWLSAGATVAEAQGASRALLGTAPVLEGDALLPGPNQRFEHRRYGTPWRPKLPPLETARDFGLFEGIQEARVELAFEQDGLRTRVTWRGATER